MFVLDTDHLGVIQWRNEPGFSRLMTRLREYAPDEVFVAMPSFHEQVMGWNTYISRAASTVDTIRGYEKLRRVIHDFSVANVLPFDDSAGNVFDSLRREGVRIGVMDMRIAAIALSKSMTLLSRNLRDFRQVPDLRIEDWTV